MGVKEAQKAVEQAQAAYSANKDKALKKALKAAKATLAEEEAKQVTASSKKRKVEETPVAAEPTKTPKKKKAEAAPEAVQEEKPKKRKKEKGLKVDITALREAVKTAKAAYKTDKTIDNKAKLKAAKTAVKEAEALVAEWAPKTPTTPAVPAPAPPPATPDGGFLAGLKSNAKKEAAPAATPKGQNNEKCTRVFVGNLPFTIDDDAIKEVFKECGTITKINWIEDKATKRFKGCGVMEFDSLESAEKAVALDKQDYQGRAINVQYSKPLGESGGNKKQASFVDAPLSEKPEGCTTCFVGNLSFAIEEDDIRQFAEDCGDIKAIRWVYHKDSGDFKGCGFVEFNDSEAADKFVAKKGTNLKGRPIRIDWSSSNPRRNG